MKTVVGLTHNKVIFDQTNDIHAVISISAPKLDRAKKRPPLCIIPVIDVSGSMGYETANSGTTIAYPLQTVNKLEYAKKSITKLIDHLQPGDYFGAVAFESAVHDVFPTTTVTDKTKVSMQAAVAKLRPMGGTDMAGGILKGIDYAKAMDLPKEVLIRVILFTDGCANQGVAQDMAGISKLMTANMGDRVTLSMFGYGHDADQELLTALASKGKGNYAFIDNPDKAATAFAKELGGLLSTYAQNITIEVEPLGENEIVKVVSDVTVVDSDNRIKIEMADLLSEETRHVVLALKTATQKQVFPRPINILAVKATYDLIDDEGKKTREEVESKVKIEFVKKGDEQKDPTQEVVEIVAIHKVLEAQLEAEQLAASGNFVAAQNVISGMQVDCGANGVFGPIGCASAAAVATDLVDKYKDSGTYSKSAGSRGAYRASVSSRSLYADAGTAMVMDACFLSNTNSVQQNFVDSFAQGDADAQGGSSVQGGVASQILADVVPASVVPIVVTSTSTPSKGLKKSRSERW